MLTRTRRRTHIAPVKSLHWLQVSFQIDFKIPLLVYKSLNGLAPDYMSDMVLRYVPTRSLRSSGSCLLIIPRVRSKTHVEAAFGHYGPSLWSGLPEDLRVAESVDIFKRKHLFSLFISLLVLLYYIVFIDFHGFYVFQLNLLTYSYFHSCVQHLELHLMYDLLYKYSLID